MFRIIFVMRDTLSEKVADNISSHALLKDGEKIIVALSGGADSVALLSICKELGLNCKASHCNFHLRGEESNRDEEFCRKLCRQLGVEITVTDFDVAKRMAATGESLEMACRNLRFGLWDGWIEEDRSRVILLAHHLEDDIETFLLNAMRGSGVAGLKGILPRRGNYLRPMLSITKTEILEYLSLRGLGYVTDSSNSDNSFKRNKIRNLILPQLCEYFPSAKPSFGRTLEILKEEYRYMTSCLEVARQRYVGEGGEINLTALLADESQPRIVLFNILKGEGFSMDVVDDILMVASSNGEKASGGQRFRSIGREYIFDRGFLRPSKSVPDEFSKLVSLDKSPFSLRKLSISEFQNLLTKRSLRKDCIYLDAEVLTGNPQFILRNWRIGDRMKPFGMKGSKLVSDLLTDAKISVDEKKRVRILLRGEGEILWVIGLRASDLYKITSGTREVLEVKYEGL